MICIKCKKEIPDGSTFCNWCGKKQIVSPHAPKKRGNGEGTVFKKPCGTWRVEYVERYVLVDGKKKRITKTKSGFKTKKEALEYLAQIKTAKVKSETKKIYELYDIIYERELKELSKDKQSHYRTAFNRISEIASMNVSELALEDLQAVVDSIDSGLSIDKIELVKDILINYVAKEAPNVYIILAAVSYEFAKDTVCIDCHNGKEVKFRLGYESYAKFIKQTAKIRDQRCSD